MKAVLILLCVLAYQPLFAWEAKEVVEQKSLGKNDSIPISTLRFKSGKGDVVTYTPTLDPYGLAEIRKYVFDDQEYFLTTWAAGASSIAIRVFRPDISHLPLCQEFSDVEEAELRKNKNIIELSVSRRNGDQYKDSWAPCYKTGDRKVNSVKGKAKNSAKAKQNTKK